MLSWLPGGEISMEGPTTLTVTVVASVGSTTCIGTGAS